MKRVLHNMQSLIAGSSFALMVSLGIGSAVYAQVDVTASGGTPTGSYTTLKGAFDAINGGTHQGTITIGISANTTETAPAVLNSSGAGAAIYTSILIQPTVDGVSVSGAIATGRGVIELKGADDVTINGDNPNSAGINRNLTIANTSANTVTLTSLIRIANATTVTSSNNVTISNCILNGNATGRNGSGMTSTTASENNTFGIYVGGNGGTTATDAPTALTSVTSNTAPTGTTINNLVISNNAVNAVARGIVFNGSEVANSNSVSITNNLIGDQTTALTTWPFTAPATTVYTKGILVSGVTAINITGNTIKNILSYVATGISGIELNSSIGSGTIDISNNTIDGISLNATSSNAARGISVQSAAGAYIISGNTVRNVQNATGSTTSTTRPNGIYVNTSAPSAMISNNNVSKIYDNNTFTYGVTAVWLNGGNNITVQNNLIYDVNQNISGGSAFSIQYGINGLAVTAGNGHKIYHNTIHLSGTMMGTATSTHLTAAFVIGSTSQTGMDVRNNIFSNTMTGGTTSIAHVSIFLPSSGASAMNLTLNNNAYYSGPTSASQGIAQVGTTAGTGFYLASNFVQGSTVGATNLRTYTSTLSAAGTNDNATIVSTTAAPFVSATDLHLSTGVTPTQLESGGAASVGVTTDIDGNMRPGPAGSVNGGAFAPDMGADEFDGVPLTAPAITLNSVTPPATPQCTVAARLVSVDVTNTSGTLVSVNLVYAVNGTPQSPVAMTNTSGATWEATIPAATPVNATVTWGVVAANSFGLNGTYTGTTYADEPTLGVTASVSSSASTVCSGTEVTLTAAASKPGIVTIGSGSTASTGSAAQTPFYGGYGGVKTQYLIRASELTAAGLVAGNITSLSMTVTGVGATVNGFAISVEPTALTALTGNIETVSNEVYSNAAFTPVLGTNNFAFSTPVAWNGTSNLIVSICWSNANTSNPATNVLISSTAFVSGNARYVDSRTSVEVCGYTGNTTPSGWNGGSTTVSSRPIFGLNGITTVPISPISWSDGVTTVGTTNPLMVSPTSTTTYEATVSISGCAVAPNPSTTVTTIALPSAPTATNSGQCGSQVPTASVASTTGLPTPTFNWYAAASGGSPLQSGTSTTYTSVVSSTTTFYVSELNTGTGCESPRTAVSVSVSSADPIAAVAAPTAVCLGESFTLTASNTAGTPLQNYSYSFESATTGSGAETPVAGNPVTITPAASGNFTYTVTGVDGLCAATNTVTVNVKPLPVLAATATPATVCSDDPIALSLTATDYTIGTVTVGTQTTTEFGGGVYRNGFGTGDFRHQLIFTAAELTAAGVQPGNITAINFYVTSVGSGSANNYTIRMGNTAATAATTSFLTDPTTQVYTAATYTAVSGTNTHTFGTPFNWDGTSNVLIDICYNISAIGGSSTLAATTPSVSRNSNLLGAAGACSAASGTTFANRPLVGFTGNVFTTINSTATIAWAPGGFTTPTATASVTNNGAGPVTQAYTVTVTNPFTGCTNTATTASVTVNESTAAPVATNSTQCGSGVPTASVTGTGTPGNTFNWYTVATGGTAIAGQSGNTLSGYNVTTTTTFYVSEDNGSCESPRTPVTVTVTPPPAVTIAGSTNLCIGSSESLTASSSNDPDYTYTWSGGLGTGATVTAAPTVNTTYTVTAVDMSGGANNGCNTTATIAITVNPVPTGVTAAASDNTICNGESVTLTSGPSSTPVALLNQNFDAGFGSWTTTYSGTAPIATQWLVQNAPFTYDGTMDFTNFATPQGGGFAMTNGDLGASGLRTRAALTSPSFSTVGMNTATLTFENLYQRWASGDSAVAVQVSTNGGTSWTNLKEYFALGVSQGTITNNAQVMVNESIVLGPALMNQPDVRIRFYYVSSWGYYWMVDNIELTGTPEALTYAWTSSPAGYSSTDQNPAAPVSPTVTTTYTMTATNTFGCTASASTTVTVNQPTTSSTPITACESYTWTDGIEYTTSGTYTQTLTNAVGCDSVATLVLTINNATTSSTPITACESYTWTDGIEYTTSGTYTQTLTNANGCDSIATLVLTINNATTSTTAITACESYIWTDGIEYTTSGTYTQMLTNANGCDSIATLALTITGTTTSSMTVSSCEEFTFNGTTYTTSGVYIDTLSSSAGCDSIVTVNLTILEPTTASMTVSECEEFTYNGTTYTASGVYVDTLTNAAGCDSIVTINLTINGLTATATDNGDFSMTASAGTSYQWVHCATGLPISGATSQTYTATVNGTYAVVVTNAAGCSDTSNCVTIGGIGIDELTDASIRVFPNPTHSDVTVTMSSGSATIEVVDVKGKLLQTIEVSTGEKVDLSAYETGVYFLRIRTDNGSAIERIVKN